MSSQQSITNKYNFRRKSMCAQQSDCRSPEHEKINQFDENIKQSQDNIILKQGGVGDEVNTISQFNSEQHHNCANKDENIIQTPKKEDIHQNNSQPETANVHNQFHSKPFQQRNLLSPTSSQSSGRSSRSSLSSPIQIRINSPQVKQQMLTTRRSMNYEISQITEKRLEDDKNAISYAEKVLMNRSFLSQQKSKQENQRYSLFVTTAQQAGVYQPNNGQQGILKKKTNHTGYKNNSTLPFIEVQPQINPQIYKSSKQKTQSQEEVLAISNNMNNNINNNEQDKGNDNNENKVVRIYFPDRSELNKNNKGSEINYLVAQKASNGSENINVSSKVRGRRTLGISENIDLSNGKEVAWMDRKTLQKITKVNTERNSIIQPERSMDDHYNKLPRCIEHSKRIKELYCVDENCQIKQKFGCVLCFSSANGSSSHNFHEYYTISSEEDLQEKINRNRGDFIQFIVDQISARSNLSKYRDEVVHLLVSYATVLQDRLYIGFEAEEIQKCQLPLLQAFTSDTKSPSRKAKRSSRDKREIYDEKELSIVLYLNLLSQQVEKDIEDSMSLWLDQKYLGEKDEEFEREKTRKLIILSKCFSNLNDATMYLFISSGELTYNLQSLENSNNSLHYISDQYSDGIYQLDADRNKQGRGIQFFKSGTVYEGYFFNNQMHGIGKLITFEGNSYVGEFKKNQKKGKGVLKYSNKDVYTGEFQADARHGQGTMYYAADQLTYIGGWTKNQRQGRGQTFKDQKFISSGIYSGDQLKQNIKE